MRAVPGWGVPGPPRQLAAARGFDGTFVIDLDKMGRLWRDRPGRVGR